MEKQNTHFFRKSYGYGYWDKRDVLCTFLNLYVIFSIKLWSSQNTQRLSKSLIFIIKQSFFPSEIIYIISCLDLTIILWKFKFSFQVIKIKGSEHAKIVMLFIHFHLIYRLLSLTVIYNHAILFDFSNFSYERYLKFMWNVLITNKMHNSYNQFLLLFLFHSFAYILNESSRSSSEAWHNILYNHAGESSC